MPGHDKHLPPRRPAPPGRPHLGDRGPTCWTVSEQLAASAPRSSPSRTPLGDPGRVQGPGPVPRLRAERTWYTPRVKPLAQEPLAWLATAELIGVVCWLRPAELIAVVCWLRPAELIGVVCWLRPAELIGVVCWLRPAELIGVVFLLAPARRTRRGFQIRPRHPNVSSRPPLPLPTAAVTLATTLLQVRRGSGSVAGRGPYQRES